MNTRKISELEQLESLNENTNFVVEDGGATKRFPANAVGAGYETDAWMELIAEEKQSFVSSFVGKLRPIDHAPFSAETQYRITIDDVVYSVWTAKMEDENYPHSWLTNIPADGFLYLDDMPSGSFAFYIDGEGRLLCKVSEDLEGTHSVKIEEMGKVVTPLDEKFIPDTIARKNGLHDMVITHSEKGVSEETALAIADGSYEGLLNKLSNAQPVTIAIISTGGYHSMNIASYVTFNSSEFWATFMTGVGSFQIRILSDNTVVWKSSCTFSIN